jgi:hypothetical protein
MKLIPLLFASVPTLTALPASAQETLIDLTQPRAVVQAMQDAGYKAALKTDDKGDPFIESAANGSNFTVQFYGCKGAKDCPSLQFYAWYKKEPWYTVDLANRWNANKRFIKAAIDKDGDLATYFDVTTVGKTTVANFADAIEWWSVMTGELFAFLEKEGPAEKAEDK